jgi:hypothetical protein
MDVTAIVGGDVGASVGVLGAFVFELRRERVGRRAAARAVFLELLHLAEASAD